MVSEESTCRPRGWRRIALVVAGTLFLVVGAIGVLIPVLPTTPFLILSALCYGRSSDRCYRWLITNRVFGRYLDNYLKGRGIPWRVKAVALMFLWGVIATTVIFFTRALWLRILLVAIATGVTVHVLAIRGRERSTSEDRSRLVP